MKQLFVPVAVLLLLAACGNDAQVKSVQKNEDGSTTTTSMDMEEMKKMGDAGGDMQKKIEELKKLTPLNLDQLKALLPESLNGMKRTSFDASSAMGYAMANGDFEKDETSKLQLTIYDCAGDAGAGMYSLTYLGAVNFQSESDKEYTKSVDFKGGKAIEHFRKDEKASTLTYVSNGRLLVVLDGQNMSPAELKEAAESLELKL